MKSHPRRRLRSTSVQLGALTALALALSGCNLVSDDDDDDCAMGPGGGGDTVAMTLRTPAPVPEMGVGSPVTETVATAVPDRGGFGSHQASCGG
ncbi:hypothetical protein GCM10009541_19500 [Micromonospora gifhornensis]|uniref:Lipoprotein n=1 Tax=Micromonospora gifhornensis TaxID=84594 RepID=A0ABQ4I9J4_9ACTN|nr:hypothetical protein [Verrucosispora sp. ts21]GIJ14496.1 hypothetical protein Vgi01_11800 [Micromonospora gifhornensis]